jgi:DNA mismatch endonuclease (patch repair protein)
MDNLKPEHRRKNMQHIRSRDTKIELAFASELKRHKIRFRRNLSKVIGKPDFVLSGTMVAIFLDSCFWHQCPYHANLPATNKKYWIPKLKGNKNRDKKVNRLLRRDGWKVIRFWEHQIRKSLAKCIERTISTALTASDGH